jgi:hypothetical protein
MNSCTVKRRAQAANVAIARELGARSVGARPIQKIAHDEMAMEECEFQRCLASLVERVELRLSLGLH